MSDVKYPKLRPMDLEPHYCQHISAMTTEKLHSKTDIAMQLAWRDKRIAELEARIEELKLYSGVEFAEDRGRKR